MMLDQSTLAKKRQFRTIFFVELWERFAFYGFNGLFVLYASTTYFSEKQSYILYGIFTALAYAFPTVGGAIADKLLGIKRTLVFGCIVLVIGYACLALAHNLEFVLIAMGIIVVGTGCFKPNPSSIVGIIFRASPSESDAAFTIYYMAINIGSFLAILICPIVAKYTNFSMAFWIAVVGMLFALSNYLLRRNRFKEINNEKDLAKLTSKKVFLTVGYIILMIIIAVVMLHFANIALYIILVVAAICYIFLIFNSLTYKDKTATIKQIVGIVLFLQAIVFFIVYSQMNSTIVLFAKHNVLLSFWGFSISPATYEVYNPFWIVVLSPFLAKIYVNLEKKGVMSFLFDKFAVSMLCCGIGFAILIVACKYFAVNGYIAGWWVGVYYLFASLAELLVSALGLSVAAQYFPKNKISFCMGAWLIAQGCGNAMAGKIATFVAISDNVEGPLKTILTYTSYFDMIAYLSFGAFVIYIIIAIILRKVAKKHNITFA